VDELITLVVADSSAMEAQSGIPQGSGLHAGQADIDGHGLHVQAVLSDSARAAAEKVVAPWGPISANHIDFGVLTAETGCEVMQQIKQARIEMMDSAGAMIAEKGFQLLDGREIVLVTPAIDHIEPLVGVRVIQPKTIAWGLGWSVEGVGRNGKKQTKKGGNRFKHQVTL
jgi:hypothetical protein